VKIGAVDTEIAFAYIKKIRNYGRFPASLPSGLNKEKNKKLTGAKYLAQSATYPSGLNKD